MRRLLRICAAAGCVFGAPSIALAADASTADALFNDANALAARGKYAEACPKLAESQRLEPAVGTQFNLADCYEHLGRTATAHALFADVAHIARAAGKFERERLANERVAALEPRLARIRIAVTAPAPGLEIKIDDDAFPKEKWAASVPIDPGRHHVLASAPARTSWQGALDTSGGKTSTLAVPELVDPDARPRADAKPPSSSQRTIAIAIAGAGVAGLAVGAIAGAMSISARSNGEQDCPEATYHFQCPTPQGSDAWNSATASGNVSTVGFVVGGIALTAAAVLWFTAPSSSAKMRAGVTTTGLRFEGSF